MTTRSRLAASVLGTLLSAAAWPPDSLAFANVDVGDPVESRELPALEGGQATLLQEGKVGVFVFFRPGHDHSLATLRRLAELEREFAGKPVSFAAVVSDGWPVEQVRAAVRQSGIRMPVLFDRGDALYGKLGVRLHPVIGVTDRRHRLAAYQPFTAIHHREAVRAHVRRALGEIDDAELAAAVAPPRGTLPGEDARGGARRDVNLGRVLLEKRGWEKALAAARKAQERDPSFGAARTLAGQALAGMGRCAEAAAEFEAALALEPGDVAAAEGKRACGR